MPSANLLISNLTSSLHTDTVTKKAHRHIYFIGHLRRIGMSTRILLKFYRCTIGSILAGCIAAWYVKCFALHHLSLQRVSGEHSPVHRRFALPSSNPSSQRIASGRPEVLSRVPATLAIPFSLFYFQVKIQEFKARTSMVKSNFFPTAIELWNQSPFLQVYQVLLLLFCYYVIILEYFWHYFWLHYNLESFCCFALIMYLLFCFFIITVCIMFAVSFIWTRNFMHPDVCENELIWINWCPFPSTVKTISSEFHLAPCPRKHFKVCLKISLFNHQCINIIFCFFCLITLLWNVLSCFSPM